MDLVNAFSSKAQWEGLSETVFFSRKWKTMHIDGLAPERYIHFYAIAYYTDQIEVQQKSLNYISVDIVLQ